MMTDNNECLCMSALNNKTPVFEFLWDNVLRDSLSSVKTYAIG